MSTKDLIQKIEKLTRERITSGDIVSLEDLKKISRITILVIEDDESMQKALQRIFESEGYRVIIAKDATELSSVLGQAQIHLIVMDVGLPWVDGFELAEMMKENKEVKKIPIVFLTGHSDPLMIKRGFAVGANDYITKPFELETVKRTVRTLLELQG